MTAEIRKADDYILYIEDCKEDIEAMERAMNSSSYSIRLQCCTSFDEAKEYILNLQDSSLQLPIPKVIFLDLRLHGLSTISLLEMIKSTPSLMAIPVLILSGSEQDSDLVKCCSHAATAYIKKPFQLSSLKFKVHTTLDFWLNVAHLPGHWITGIKKI
ncbi:MAG: hypothetical protein CMO81_03310 [Waddliaceae bacterium]|nr:hypothetical protein [Waddliaceae bacterium]